MAKKIKKISAGNKDSSQRIRSALAKACAGLVYISETDSEIVPFLADVPDPRSNKDVVDTARLDPGAQIEVYDFKEFAAKLTAIKDWYGDEERMRAARYSDLFDLLSAELTDLRVLRVGRVRIDILVVGITNDGRAAGFRTYAVET